MLNHINSAEAFDFTVLGGSGVQFALFTAAWCPYCRVQGPRLLEFEKALGINLNIVDVDAAAGVDDRYDVQTIPSLLVFAGGELKDRRMIAYDQPADLEAWIKGQL